MAAVGGGGSSGAGAQPSAALPRFNHAAAAAAEQSYKMIDPASQYYAGAQRNLAALYRAWARFADPLEVAGKLSAAAAVYRSLREGGRGEPQDALEEAACLVEGGDARGAAALGLKPPPPLQPDASAEAVGLHLRSLLTLTNVLLGSLGGDAAAGVLDAGAGRKAADLVTLWEAVQSRHKVACEELRLAAPCGIPQHGGACTTMPGCAVAQLRSVPSYLAMRAGVARHVLAVEDTAIAVK